jgi:hypothetical protein
VMVMMMMMMMMIHHQLSHVWPAEPGGQPCQGGGSSSA